MKEAHNHLLEVLDIIEHVRGENGCPWVREQDPNSLVTNVQDELNEVKEALQKNDLDNLAEELGDVLWDVLMLIKVCEDEHAIDVKQSLIDLRDKMIRRRPYVFGNEKAETVEEALAIWKRVKEEEKKNP